MLFPFFPSPQDLPTPRTEVRSFAIYSTERLAPEDRRGTLVLSRTTRADGTSTTTLRTTPDRPAGRGFLAFAGEGRIDRDAKGIATRIESRLYDLTTAGPQKPVAAQATWTRGSGGVLEGKVEGKEFRTRSSALPLGIDFRLDPLEAIVFDGERVLNSEWVVPSPFDGESKIGNGPRFLPPAFTRYRLGGAFLRPAVFGGAERPLVFRPLLKTWDGPAGRGQSMPGGFLAYAPDGSLAAIRLDSFSENYPSNTTVRGAGTVGFRNVHPFPPTPDCILVPL